MDAVLSQDLCVALAEVEARAQISTSLQAQTEFVLERELQGATAVNLKRLSSTHMAAQQDMHQTAVLARHTRYTPQPAAK